MFAKVSKKSRTVFLKILGYVIILGLAAYLLINTDFNEILRQLSKVSIKTFSILIGLQLITQFLINYQWYKITEKVRGKETSFFKIMHIFTRGSVVEAITPGAKIGGEVTRLYYLKKDFDCSTEQATSIIIIQKSISMSVLLSLCLFAFIYLTTIIGSHIHSISQALISFSCLFFVVLMISLLFFSHKLEKVLLNQKNSFLKKMGHWVSAYSTSTKKLSKNEWITQFILSLVVWILFPLKMSYLMYHFGIALSFLIVFAVTMTSYLAGMFPITPGGLGTFEGTMLALLGLLSIDASISFTITIIFRLITFWFVILSSLLYVLIYNYISNKKRGVFLDARKKNNETHS